MTDPALDKLTSEPTEDNPADMFLVVTDPAQAEAWRTALAAINTSLRIDVVDESRGLEHVSPKHLTVIMTQPRIARGEMGGLSMTDASRLLAQASDLPAGTTFLADHGAIAGSMVEIFSTPIQFPSVVQDAAGDPPHSGDREALALYGDGPPAVGSRAVWQQDIFTFDAKACANSREPGDLDLVGRARYLIHGPYFWLPRGSWRATIRFAVDDDASVHNFRFEWGGAEVFSQLAILPGKPGFYEAQLDHDLSDAESMEFRLVIPQSVLAGRMLVQQITVERIG